MCRSESLEKETAQRTVDISISNILKTRPTTKVSKQEPGKLVHSYHAEANEEYKLHKNMPTFKNEFAGNPNSCIMH